MDLSPLTLTVVSVCVATFIAFVRRLILPRPLAGIPYNKQAAFRIAGDVPELRASHGVRAFMRDQFTRHKSPIVQVFLAPFSKPRVLIGDFCEAHDIAAGRYREFDKSRLTSDSFKGIVPRSFVSYKAEHPVFKHNKELLKDFMTPSFFRNVSGPETHRNTLLLIDLWQLKLQLGGGRPFDAARDIYKMTLDVFTSVTFDRLATDTLVRRQLHQLRKDTAFLNDRSDAKGSPAQFAHLPLPADLQACVYLTESINIGFQSPVPRLAHWIYLQSSHSRLQTRLKNEYLRQKVQESFERLSATQFHEPLLLSAVDTMLIRERVLAAKTNTVPDFFGTSIRDELFTFIAGGHDNSASLLTWFVKFMAAHPTVQAQLRRDIRVAHHDRKQPSAEAIIDAHVPFLEAVIEETIRCSHIVPITAREALVDTTVMGCAIPKGTHVYLVSNGPSFLTPALEVDEALRSETGRVEGARYGAWKSDDVGDFVPERWLKGDAFDPMAGPQMAFGGGPRGCFGRKMVYLELRIAVTLLILTFEFRELDEKLNTFGTWESTTENPVDCHVWLKTIS